jgi:Xaa-Pro aminopeptidase
MRGSDERSGSAPDVINSMQNSPSGRRPPIPFSAELLDSLLDEAGIDVLVATSKHNVQYLLGGHRALFFDYMDAMGVSRYLPIFVYVKGASERAAYFGHRLEKPSAGNQPVLGC